MIAATCHCGAVRIEVPYPPATVTDCNCTLCRRYGVLWAYYNEADVRVFAQPGVIDEYIRGRKEQRFGRCNACGCVMFWQKLVAADGNEMGVNARNFEPNELAAARVEKLDGFSLS